MARDALRYMGAGKAEEADTRLLDLVEACFAELEVAKPRHMLATYPAKTVKEAFGSAALSAHLEGCEQAALLAATLGAQADQLIRRAEAVDTLRAAALHACAAAKIEAYCDAVQACTKDANRPRFSPGYADFPLEAQRTLLRLTDAGRRIGLYLTEGCMLVPSKSVTAVMGLGPALAGCPTDKCTLCDKLDCTFRGESQCN